MERGRYRPRAPNRCGVRHRRRPPTRRRYLPRSHRRPKRPFALVRRVANFADPAESEQVHGRHLAGDAGQRRDRQQQVADRRLRSDMIGRDALVPRTADGLVSSAKSRTLARSTRRSAIGGRSSSGAIRWRAWLRLSPAASARRRSLSWPVSKCGPTRQGDLGGTGRPARRLRQPWRKCLRARGT